QRAERIDVETRAIAGSFRALASVTQAQAERTIRLTWYAPDRTPNRMSVDGNFNAIFVGDVQIFRRLVADHNGVVPGQTRDRSRQLLQPAVVSVAAVEHVWIEMEGYVVALPRRR